VPFRLPNCTAARTGDDEESPRPTTANWKRISRPGDQQALVLEALQRRVDRADGVLASRSLREISANRQAVRVLIEASNGKKGRELEGAKRR
jgi:hypothetical protein